MAGFVSAVDIPDELRGDFSVGSQEIELVRSGLEDVMQSAYLRMSEALRENPGLSDFRTAAYVVSIGKIADAYEAVGI